MIKVRPETAPKGGNKRKRTVGQPGGVPARDVAIPVKIVTELTQREPGAGKNRRPAPPVLEVVSPTGDGLDRVTFSAPKAERWPERLEAARAVRGLRSTSEVIRELLTKALREVTP